VQARITWQTADRLVAIEPTLDEVRVHAPALVAAYNDPQNAPLLGHASLLVEQDVIDHYAGLLEAGAHPFLLFRDDALAGDGDLRGVTGGAAEFAFLIAAPSAQGRGLGTRFATMIHAHGFGSLGLERIYASVIPANVASRRVFDKLGYVVDDSPAAREFGDEGDTVLRVDREGFLRQHAAAVAEIQIAMR
jgi:RimJ/RimL family protein N-acetyltransferase